MARTHALDRVQFGRPLASFQAVRHRLAEALVALDAAEATPVDAVDDLGSLLAKVAAGQAALTTARHCQQVLGGIGFTAEYGLHRHVRRVLVLDCLLGSTRELTRFAELMEQAGTADQLELEMWMRTPPVSAELAAALTAYATDLSLIGTALLPLEGLSQRDAGTASASAVTSHTLWFHRPFRTDGWLLLRQDSPVLATGAVTAAGRADRRRPPGRLLRPGSPAPLQAISPVRAPPPR